MSRNSEWEQLQGQMEKLLDPAARELGFNVRSAGGRVGETYGTLKFEFTKISANNGIGKSQIIKKVARKMHAQCKDVRAVLLDPVDLRGLPHVKDGKPTGRTAETYTRFAQDEGLDPKWLGQTFKKVWSDSCTYTFRILGMRPRSGKVVVQCIDDEKKQNWLFEPEVVARCMNASKSSSKSR